MALIQNSIGLGRSWILAAWLAGVAAGFLYIARYESSPGLQASTPARWPAATQLGRAEDRFNLVLFLHPRCPCSRATLREFERLYWRIQNRIRAQIVFYDDPDLGLEWRRSSLRNQAESLPGVIVTDDPYGRIAMQFGATTSGHAVLYSSGGELLFRGGLTNTRGHEGDSAGKAAIQALVFDRSCSTSQCPTFGCPLRASAGSENEYPDETFR